MYRTKLYHGYLGNSFSESRLDGCCHDAILHSVIDGLSSFSNPEEVNTIAKGI